jgi:hypothetical protein
VPVNARQAASTRAAVFNLVNNMAFNTPSVSTATWAETTATARKKAYFPALKYTASPTPLATLE